MPFEREHLWWRASGATACYDVIENVHRNHILHSSTLAQLPAALQETAKNMAEKLAAALDYVGVLAIECFVVGDALLINDRAARAQFRLGTILLSVSLSSMRAITGWPLGDATAQGNAVMSNLLGGQIEQWRDLAAQKATHASLRQGVGRKNGPCDPSQPENN